MGQHGVDHAKDGGVDAEAESDRKDDGYGERSRTHKGTQCLSDHGAMLAPPDISVG